MDRLCPEFDGKGLTAIINAVVHGPPWPQDEALRDIRVEWSEADRDPSTPISVPAQKH
jgi:hypothetical protein